MKKGAKIKVIGIGGSGGNAVNRMMGCHIDGVDFIAINSDFQDLKKIKATKKIQIGKKSTKGLGSGMDPRKGAMAVLEDQEEIKKNLAGADIIFIVCGLGGGTGTGAAPIVADIAKQTGALTIGAVTMPFSFEGAQRKRIAQIGKKKLQEKVDTLFVIPNDNLLQQIDEGTTCFSAFWACDEILRQAVQGISDLIIRPGIINLDFADVKAIMSQSGSALFGVGAGQGENKVQEATLAALNSPSLDFTIEKAKRILLNVTGGKNLSLVEIQEAVKIITKNSPVSRIIFGAIQDNKLKPDEVKITLIAAGIE